jgi:hypothetical protein
LLQVVVLELLQAGGGVEEKEKHEGEEDGLLEGIKVSN